MVATDWSHQLRCKHCGKVVARSVLDDMKAQIALGVCCISQAVYMLRTKMYWFKTTPNDVNTYIYIGQQLKRRRTCPIGWRGHVFRWHVHTFWLPKLWNRQIPGETCYGSAVSTAESGSAPGHCIVKCSVLIFAGQLLNITTHLQRNSLPQHSVGLCRRPGVGCKNFLRNILNFDILWFSTTLQKWCLFIKKALSKTLKKMLHFFVWAHVDSPPLKLGNNKFNKHFASRCSFERARRRTRSDWSHVPSFFFFF